MNIQYVATLTVCGFLFLVIAVLLSCIIFAPKEEGGCWDNKKDERLTSSQEAMLLSNMTETEQSQGGAGFSGKNSDCYTSSQVKQE